MINIDFSRWDLTKAEEKALAAHVNAILDWDIPIKQIVTDSHIERKPKHIKALTKKVRYIKDASISLRLQSNILELVKQQAAQQGVPYQTLIGSWIYQHAMSGK